MRLGFSVKDCFIFTPKHEPFAIGLDRTLAVFGMSMRHADPGCGRCGLVLSKRHLSRTCTYRLFGPKAVILHGSELGNIEVIIDCDLLVIRGSVQMPQSTLPQASACCLLCSCSRLPLPSPAFLPPTNSQTAFSTPALTMPMHMSPPPAPTSGVSCQSVSGIN